MHQGHLLKAAVELAKDWRTDRALRKLEAMLIVADEKESLIITVLVMWCNGSRSDFSHWFWR